MQKLEAARDKGGMVGERRVVTMLFCDLKGSTAAAEGLDAAHDLLAPFGHWVTPVIRPRRFDTLFFVAPAPPGQLTEPDGSEVVRCLWDFPWDFLQALRSLAFA